MAARAAAEEDAGERMAAWEVKSGQVASAQKTVAQLQARLTSLKGGGAADPLSLWRGTANGEKVLKLVDLIKKNAKDFSVQPIGPLALYVTMNDFKYADAVESRMPKLMHGFAGTCARVHARCCVWAG
jgi:hypothetical protein